MDIGSPSHVLAGKNTIQLVVFGLDDLRYALHLSVVGQIVRMVEITALPEAPAIILGVVNIRGEITPVFDIRKRFHLPERKIDPGDYLIVARTSSRTVALVADQVLGVRSSAAETTTEAEQIFSGLSYLEGVVKFEDGLVFIHDLDTFLSHEEETATQHALTLI